MACRALNPGDLDAVARIWLEGWMSTGIILAEAPTYPVLRARIEHEVSAAGWQVIVAEAEGSPAGFVAITPSNAVVEQIFVAPEFHRRGIGKALLMAAWRAMPDGFSLWTHGENKGAALFYDQMGMVLVGPGVHPRHSHPILTYAFGRCVQ